MTTGNESMLLRQPATLRLADLAGSLEKFWTIDTRREPVFAVAIASDSDLDRCYICSGSPPAPEASAGLSEAQRQRNIDPLIQVSVERPFIGRLNGPLYVVPPYGVVNYRTAAGLVGRVVPGDQALYNMPSSGSLGPSDRGTRLRLQLYPFLPPFIPEKRAPLEHTFFWPLYDTLPGTSANKSIIVPGFGRKQLSLSLKMSGWDSGDLTWNMYGINHATSMVSATEWSAQHTLSGPNVEGADFNRTYFFDGEFDYYWLALDATSLATNVEVSGFIKAWD